MKLRLVAAGVVLAVTGCAQTPDPGWTVAPPSPEPPASEDRAPQVLPESLAPFQTQANGATADWFSDGQFAIGAYVIPGTYETTPEWEGCYWEIATDFSGRPGTIVTNGTAEPGERIQITLRPTDTVIKSRGCGTWHMTDDSKGNDQP